MSDNMQMPQKKPEGDELFDALSSKHRRRILVALLEHNPQADVAPTPDDDPSGIDETAAREEELKRRRIEFYHVHLPKLADYGFIDWDRDRGEVTKGPRFEDIEPCLLLLRDNADDLPGDCL